MLCEICYEKMPLESKFTIAALKHEKIKPEICMIRIRTEPLRGVVLGSAVYVFHLQVNFTLLI